MRHCSLLIVSAISSAVLLAPALTSAQAPSDAPQNAAAVEALFVRAVKDMAAGNHAAARVELEKAVNLAPEAAIGARLKLAECHEKLGELASAWREYKRASEIAAGAGKGDQRKTEQAEAAQKEAARLEPMLARLTLRLPASLRGIRGLRIEIGKLSVDEADWNQPFLMDRGDHTITLSAAGYKQREIPVSVQADGTEVEVKLPMLIADAAIRAQSTTAAPTHTATPISGQPASLSSGRTKVPGFVLGGMGVAALAVGGALVGVAVGKLEENERIAPRDARGEPICRRNPSAGEDPMCSTLRSNADFVLGPGHAGIGILVGGGVLLGAGVLWLMIPSKKVMDPKTARLVPILSKDRGGLIFSGTF